MVPAQLQSDAKSQLVVCASSQLTASEDRGVHVTMLENKEQLPEVSRAVIHLNTMSLSKLNIDCRNCYFQRCIVMLDQSS